MHLSNFVKSYFRGHDQSGMVADSPRNGWTLPSVAIPTPTDGPIVTQGDERTTLVSVTTFVRW